MLLHKPHTMLKSIVGISLLASSAVVLSGCQTQPEATEQTTEDAAMATLTTQVTYLDRSMLRPGSQLTVTLACCQNVLAAYIFIGSIFLL